MIDGVPAPAWLAGEFRPLVYQLYYLVRRQTPQHQLTFTQGSVLRALDGSGPARMSALAEAEGVRLPTMTDVVRRLARLGLVRREPDPTDRRAVLVSVTERGMAYRTELARAHTEFLTNRLAELPVADRVAIAAALPALHRLLNPQQNQEAGQ